MNYDLRFTIARLWLLLICLFHFAFCIFNSSAQVHVQVSLRDLGQRVVARRAVLLTPLAPYPRTQGTNLFTRDSLSRFTDTAGLCTFSNVMWGTYRLDVFGLPAASYNLSLGTNLSGVISAAAVVTNPQTLPPNPVTNFYTMAQVDALLNSLHRGTNFNFTFVASIPLVSYALVTGAGNSELNGRYYLDTNYPGGKTYVSEFDSEFLLHQTDTNAFIWTCESGDVSWYSSVSSATIPAAGLYNNVTPGFSVTPPGPTVSIVYTNSPATNVCTLNFTNGLLWRVSAP